MFRGGALSARYFSFSSSLSRISCSNSSLAFATIRLCTHVDRRIINNTTIYFVFTCEVKRSGVTVQTLGIQTYEINPSMATHNMTSAALLWSNTCITRSFGRKKLGRILLTLSISFLEAEIFGFLWVET